MTARRPNRPSRSEQEAESAVIARHEAGHAVVACWLSIDIAEVNLQHTAFDFRRTPTDEDMLLIAMAGDLAVQGPLAADRWRQLIERAASLCEQLRPAIDDVSQALLTTTALSGRDIQAITAPHFKPYEIDRNTMEPRPT